MDQATLNDNFTQTLLYYCFITDGGIYDINADTCGSYGYDMSGNLEIVVWTATEPEPSIATLLTYDITTVLNFFNAYYQYPANLAQSNQLVSQLTTTQRDSIPIGLLIQGYIIYNTTTLEQEYWSGSAWLAMSKANGISYDDAQAGPNFGSTNVQQILNTLKTQSMLTGGYNAMSQDMNIGDNNIQQCHNINSTVRGYALTLGNTTDGIALNGATNCYGNLDMGHNSTINSFQACLSWGMIHSSGVAIGFAFNCQPSQTSTGTYTIVFNYNGPPTPGTPQYCVTLSPAWNGAGNPPLTAAIDYLTQTGNVGGGFTVYIKDPSGVLTDSSFSYTVFGTN